MRVGVTGGAGFLGGHVCDVLRLHGHEPVIFDRRGKPDFLGDVCDPVATMELAAHVDGVIHLAAMLGTQEWINDPKPAAQTNIFGTLNVLEACRANSVPLTYIAVGNHVMNNSYSTSKTCAERYCRQFADMGHPVNIVRAMNAYGPRQSVAKPYGSAKVRKIVPSFAVRALCGDPIEVYGDGLQVSDCVYVVDVAGALVNALELAAQGHILDRVVEVGPAEHHTVLQVAELIRELTGSSSLIVHLPMRPGEEPGARVVADVSTLELVSMTSDYLVPLESGLSMTVRWFAENEGVTWRRP